MEAGASEGEAGARKREQTEIWPSASNHKPQNLQLFSRLDADLFFAHQLFRRGKGASVLDGVSGSDQRRERIRQQLLGANLAGLRVLGHRLIAQETLAEAFQRLYGEPL